jgi:monoamine oxidase
VTSHLNNYYPNMPEPTSWQITRWEEDIFSQGAYSYHDCNITDEDVHNVYKNIDNVIFFAGEHTDPIYYGSLHAAYNSGIRVLDEMNFRWNIFLLFNIFIKLINIFI